MSQSLLLWAPLLVFATGCEQAKTISLLDVASQTTRDAGASRDSGKATAGCVTSDDCAAPKAHCDTLTKQCVQCLVNEDCTTQVCNSVSHACTGCVTNADCESATPYCDADDRKCVECSIASQCAKGQVCAWEAHRCAPACLTNSDCSGSGHPICAAASRVCVECTSDADCAAVNLEPHCDLRLGACVECLTDGDCSSGHCETFENRCVECTSNLHCNGRICDNFVCLG